jgi:Uncharacterized protein conserved in bacteria (DUF2066)
MASMQFWRRRCPMSTIAEIWHLACRGAGIGTVGLLALCVGTGPAWTAGKEDRVYVVGNFPVEARAGDAVEAKTKAVAEGQQAAFRSLLKRIVPVTAYPHMATLKSAKAGDLIDGVSVRSERNSSTEYIATYDFTFQAEAVRRLLDEASIPFFDRQAPQITLVPIYVTPKGQSTPEPFDESRGSDAWLYAWKGLDLADTLTPVALKPMGRELKADQVAALATGDGAAARKIAADLRTEAVVAAVLEPDLENRKIKVVLVGRDAVAPFVLRRTYRLEGPDLAFTAELAAVISLGVLEGRWKAINVRTTAAARPPAGFSGRPRQAAERQPSPAQMPRNEAAVPAEATFRISVEFRSMGEWEQISRQLAATPDVADLDVEGMSGRGARVTLRYPGGPQNLAIALAQQGLVLRSAGSAWVLAARAN